MYANVPPASVARGVRFSVVSFPLPRLWGLPGVTELHHNRVGVIPGPEHSASVPLIGADVPSVPGICGLLVNLSPGEMTTPRLWKEWATPSKALGYLVIPIKEERTSTAGGGEKISFYPLEFLAEIPGVR